MSLTAKVKKLALANHLDYVGVASVERLQNEPSGYGPTDYLPNAKTVISLGIKLGLGVQLANKLAHQVGPRYLIFSYLWHGFGIPNMHFLDRTSLLITRLLEKEGYLAVPVMSSSPFDIRSSLMDFSNHHAAVAAGLGELGWSGLALTPDMGARVRFGSIITNAELEIDPMYSGINLCDIEKCKKSNKGVPACEAKCPTKAITCGTEQVIIGDRKFEVAKFGRYRCMWGSMGLSKSSLGMKDIPMPEEVGLEDVFRAMKERDPNQAGELLIINRGDYCGQCMMECPAGSPRLVDETILAAIEKHQNDKAS